MHFVGSKGGEGIAQWIISAMPHHSVYVECCLGKGKVMLTKLPAAENIGIEASSKVISNYWAGPIDNFELIHGNALDELAKMDLPQDALVYADPPYLMETRSCKRRYYDNELLTIPDHQRLLSVLQELPCYVMLSGYWSELYAQTLPTWRTSWKWTVNRRGKLVKEWLWMNFPEPTFFHDTRFTGSDFTDRQRIKRKADRWRKKFVSMGPSERMAVMDALLSVVDDRSQSEATIRTEQSDLTLRDPIAISEFGGRNSQK